MEISVSQRKEFIILTAIDLIHEKGINNVSTKEIARRLDISEALIFKLFPKKTDIISAVLEHFVYYDKALFHSAIDKYQDPIEAIQFYINSFLRYYENYPAITALFQVFDNLKGNPELEEKTKSIYHYRMDYIVTLVKRAQDAGRVNQQIDTDSIATILVSIINGMCLKWRLEDYTFSLKEKTLYSINIILKSIIIPETL